MGLAWLDDDDAPSMEERTLRTGGVPLLAPGQPWPSCPRCAMPLLFRAQIPLAVTSLVDVTDGRLLSVFECHAEGEHGPCDGGEVLVLGGALAPADAPRSEAHDVVLVDLGEDPTRVWRVIEDLFAANDDVFDSLAPPPVTIVPASPRSIAEQAVSVVEEAGGQAILRPTPVTQLDAVHGGRIVPFEDGYPGTRKTTLPPLSRLLNGGSGRHAAMRGLFGGMTPGYRDHPYACACGKPTRTAVRLLGQRAQERSGIQLGPATVQICLACSRATLHRVSSG